VVLLRRNGDLARDPDGVTRERDVDLAGPGEDGFFDPREEPALLRELFDEVLEILVFAAAASRNERRLRSPRCPEKAY
jgi:hypothetical protein